MIRTQDNRRAAFTLVEIMIVVIILSILLALLLPVLSRAYKFGEDAAAHTEITQIDTAIAAARRDLGYGGVDLAYLPSKLKLSETNNYPNQSTVGSDDFNAVVFLQKAFGKNINLTANGLTVGTSPTAGTWPDWNGDGKVSADVTLLGDQVLIFLLGGIPASGVPSGFATNPTNPTMSASSTTSGNRKGPYFDFVQARLTLKSTDFAPNNTLINNGFFWYLDPYKQQPYIYLSSYAGGGYQTGDIPTTLGFGLTSNYTDSNTSTAINPRTYQLISAGRDGKFGPGGSWNPTTGYAITQPLPDGFDDQANFSKSLLGKPAN
jgi:prepilin-type N-terminal cleavage/methylation domain-containing protein